ncbi:MAG: TonB-dependent receptor [Gemmatimonadota bacterium]
MTIGAVVLLSRPLFAQETGVLAGRVTNGQGEPMAGASVHVAQTELSATTGADGRYRIERVTSGFHRVDVAATGHASVTRRVLINSGATVDADFVLRARIVALEAFDVRGEPVPGSMRPADDILGNLLTVGAKSEVVQVGQMNGNLAEKTARQLFARVPGVFVYDMDGSGNQVNVSTRGLDAHRSWEMNVRQDGVIINSDLYGYPASHYSPPMEAIERVELIRGTAALQYGSQFGGFLNYVTKEPVPGERLKLESNSAMGAFGLRSSYASLSGSSGPVAFHAYGQVRNSEGFRNGSRSEAGGQYLAASWQATETFKFRVQAGRAMYLFRLPGPLTDSMFKSDPTRATRTRNYFNPDIIIPAVMASWEPSGRTKLTAQLSGVFGDRASVQFVGFANQPDTVLTATGAVATRQVDIDRFNSKTAELRLTRTYLLGARRSVLSTGLAVSINDLHRRQQGTGTTGSDANFTLSTGTFRRDIHYKTNNVAWFAENDLQITPTWSIVPGIRLELGKTKMTGTLAYYDPADVPTEVDHRYPNFGLRTVKRWSRRSETYGGWSQAYRPMILQDVLPANALERSDKDLEDVRGWTVEAGQRGVVGTVTYDVSAFAMRIANRFGVLQLSDSAGPFLFKTNIGTSMTRGIELSADVPLLTSERIVLRASTATSLFDARYTAGTIAWAGANLSVVGNRVEVVPQLITRNGLHLAAGRMSMSAQLSYVGESFADALNTETPSATGAVGTVPAYAIVDLNGSIGLTSRVRLRGGVNNLLNASYFTKRPSFYPGPGVWPSDGRAAQVSLMFDAPLARAR